MSTVPMFAPDGSLGDVPADRAHEALAAGFKAGVGVVAPTGQAGIIPHDKLPDAFRSGFAPANPSPLPTQLPGQQAGGAERFADAFAANVPGPKGILGMLQTMMGAPSEQQIQELRQPPSRPTFNDLATKGAQNLGFNTDSIAADGRNRDYAGMAGDIAGPIALMALLKKASPDMPGTAADTAAMQQRALSGLLSRGKGMGSNFVPDVTAQTSAGPLLQAAADNPALARQATNGAPHQIFDAMDQLHNQALNGLEAEHSAIRGSVAHQPAFGDTQPQYEQTLQNLHDSLPSSALQDRGFIQGLKNQIGQTTTVSDLNNMRKFLNDRAAKTYDKGEVLQGEAPVSSQAYRTAADSVRSDYYQRLKDLTGVDMTPTMQKESSLMAGKQSLGSMKAGILAKQAQAVEPSPLIPKIINAAQTGGAIKGVAKTIGDHFTGTQPISQPRFLIKKFLSTLPEPTQSTALTVNK